jgi:hypothetical protein
MTITTPSALPAKFRVAATPAPEGVIRLAEGDPPLLIGTLPDGLTLPCEGGSWTVHLSYPSYEHICRRRETNSPELLEIVLRRLGMVISGPAYVGNLSGEANKLDVFSWIEGDPAGVLACIKCLRGESWVSTAFPMGRKSLRKHLNTGKLRLLGSGV